MTVLPVLLALSVAPGIKVLPTRVIAASMFKNGYALVQREVRLSGDGTYAIDDYGMGTLGTVWIGVSDGVRLKSVKATDRKVTVSTPLKEVAKGIADLLRLNQGTTVTLDLNEAQPVTGTIQQILSDFVAIKVGAKTVMVPIAAIKRVSAPNGLAFEKQSVVKSEGFRRSIVLDVKAPKDGRLLLYALERGLTWAPSYSLTLQKDKTLVLDSKAVVLNDLIDLKNAAVRFVTGFPNVEFLNKMDPLTTPMSMDQFLSSLMSDGFQPQASVMMNQAGGFGGGGGRGGFAPASPAPVGTAGSGEASEDLFFYSQPDVDLKKGERGYFSITRVEVPFERVFVWDVRDTGPMVRPEYSPTPVTPDEDVWSTIRFVNKSKMPLTTGPATTFADGQMIGQALLKYTSTGEEAQIKLTKALDVRPDALEEEVERQRGAMNLYGTVFDLVTIKGTLQATNRKSETVKLVVTKSMMGELLEASGEPKKSKTTRGLRDLNGGARVEWTVSIEPGKTIELTYRYRVYART